MLLFIDYYIWMRGIWVKLLPLPLCKVTEEEVGGTTDKNLFKLCPYWIGAEVALLKF